MSSCRISTGKLSPKLEAKCNLCCTMLYTEYRGWQKCTLFHLLATLLATFASRGHNSLLDEYRCTQIHIVPMYMPAWPSNRAMHIQWAYVQMFYTSLQQAQSQLYWPNVHLLLDVPGVGRYMVSGTLAAGTNCYIPGSTYNRSYLKKTCIFSVITLSLKELGRPTLVHSWVKVTEK